MATQSRLPDDLKGTLATEQWWLFNTGQKTTNNYYGKKGTPGIDINVLPLWPQYTGKDIKVGIVDTGIDKDHEDLKENFTQPSEADIEKTMGNLDGNHGTSVAGIIAAKRNNLGTVGVAYDATFGGYRFGVNLLNSLAAQPQFDVSNNSWAFPKALFIKGEQEVEAINNAVTKGRKNLGTVFVFAGGNSRDLLINPNLAPEQQRGNNVNLTYQNSRYVINVAAIDNNGVVAPYSNPGAPLLVSAFGDGGSIATVDRTGDQGSNPNKQHPEDNFTNYRNYTNDFNGTSSAAPMVSGVVALILQANPKLGYRDVQEILAYSARKNDPENQEVKSSEYKSGTIPKDTWKFNGAKNWNGGGLHVNHDYGFGLVDATAAVRLAETWQLRSGTGKNEAATAAPNEKVRIAPLTLPTPLDIPDNNPQALIKLSRSIIIKASTLTSLN